MRSWKKRPSTLNTFKPSCYFYPHFILVTIRLFCFLISFFINLIKWITFVNAIISRGNVAFMFIIFIFIYFLIDIMWCELKVLMSSLSSEAPIHSQILFSTSSNWFYILATEKKTYQFQCFDFFNFLFIFLNWINMILSYYHIEYFWYKMKQKIIRMLNSTWNWTTATSSAGLHWRRRRKKKWQVLSPMTFSINSHLSLPDYHRHCYTIIVIRFISVLILLHTDLSCFLLYCSIVLVIDLS